MQARMSIIVTLLISCLSQLLADKKAGEQLVEEAWKSWESNQQQVIEEKFRAAIAADSTNIRAHLGLSLLYGLQEKYRDSWKSYRKILDSGVDYQAYIFAAWSTSEIIENRYNPASGIQDMWQNMSEDPDVDGILRAMANQELGEYYQVHGDMEKSHAYFAKTNAIRNWTVIGPFDNVSASGFSRVFPPESEYRFGKTYDGKNGVPAKWHKVTEVRADNWIDFRRYYAYTDAVFYGNTFVYSPDRKTVQLRIGTSGSLKAFLNDELVISYIDENNNDLDTYIVETELQQGWNRLLVKCGFSEISQCNFLVRITDSGGAAIPELKIDTAIQKYPVRPGAVKRVIPNFAEAFFQQQIKENPGHLENYILLANCYLRNDKAVEGELALREAIRLAPQTALFYKHILEAYTRGEKFDEIATTMEKIFSLDPQVPIVVQYKYNQYLENEQLDKAEEYLNHLRRLMSGSADLLELELGYYSAKRDIEKIISTVAEGHQKFPDSWQFANAQAAISQQTTRSYTEAINIYRNYLNRRYSTGVLAKLAETYLQASNIPEWEATYAKIFEMEPSSTGYYYQQAKTYNSLQQYENADKTIRKAIEICPNSSTYWDLLAEVNRSAGNTEVAISAYQEALTYNPANYEARETLRELRGKPSIFAHFETSNIEEMIGQAPDAAAYPNDDALILFNNVNRVVYPEGTSEMAEELLIRVLNNRGLDDFKEYWIEHNGHTEGLTVEEAKVIKSDGTEIKADVNRNHAVFKSLEEGDFIYLKWRVKNYYTGKLSNHFWDQFFFNGYYPIKDIRYNLLVPDKFKFSHNTQHMDIKPKKRKTPDGTIYQWGLTDEPAIVYEYGMPILEDIGKVLHISSITDWEYMVNWYIDIAQSKTRSSYEIREQVEQLFAGKEGLSTEEKVKIIYNFITENIRYSSVSFRQSGLIPQQARDVLVNRIGDCKDVSTLCIAMLNEVGVKAHYVLVNTRDEGYNDDVLPSIAFNHCIAGVETADGIQYLDLTANNFPYGSVPTMDLDGFSLLIKPGVKAPERLAAQNFISRNLIRNMQVTIKPDNSIEADKQGFRTGALAASMRAQYRDQAPAAREKSLQEVLANDYPNVRLTGFDLDNLEEVDLPLSYRYSYLVPDYVSEVGKFKFMKIPWTDNLAANKALSYEDRHYPYYYWPRADTLREEVEIIMPAGYEPVELGQDIQLSCAAADYSLSYRYENGVIKGRREMVHKLSVILPEHYREFRSFYYKALKADERQILLRIVDQN